jgi:hypothetical protein
MAQIRAAHAGRPAVDALWRKRLKAEHRLPASKKVDER